MSELKSLKKRKEKGFRFFNNEIEFSDSIRNLTQSSLIIGRNKEDLPLFILKNISLNTFDHIYELNLLSDSLRHFNENSKLFEKDLEKEVIKLFLDKKESTEFLNYKERKQIIDYTFSKEEIISWDEDNNKLVDNHYFHKVKVNIKQLIYYVKNYNNILELSLHSFNQLHEDELVTKVPLVNIDFEQFKYLEDKLLEIKKKLELIDFSKILIIKETKNFDDQKDLSIYKGIHFRKQYTGMGDLDKIHLYFKTRIIQEGVELEYYIGYVNPKYNDKIEEIFDDLEFCISNIIEYYGFENSKKTLSVITLIFKKNHYNHLIIDSLNSVISKKLTLNNLIRHFKSERERLQNLSRFNSRNFI